MIGFELVGVLLVSIAIVIAFVKKQDKLAISLIITLLVLLLLLNQLGYLDIF